jgi:hypothetical protein
MALESTTCFCKEKTFSTPPKIQNEARKTKVAQTFSYLRESELTENMLNPACSRNTLNPNFECGQQVIQSIPGVKESSLTTPPPAKGLIRKKDCFLFQGFCLGQKDNVWDMQSCF